jgi:hypothetical protein
LPVENRGIPHLAKNERDVGHTILVVGTERRSLAVSPGIRDRPL